MLIIIYKEKREQKAVAIAEKGMQERIKLYAAWIIVCVGGAAAAYLFFKYIFGIFLPFVIGWAAALAVRTPANVLHRKLKIHEGALRLVLAVGAVSLFGVLLVCGVKVLAEELSRLLVSVGNEPSVLLERVTDMVSRMPFFAVWKDSGNVLLGELRDALLRALPTLISSLATALPGLLLGIGVGMIATVYFCLDLDRVHSALLRLMPHKWHEVLHFAKKNALRAVFTVLRANFVLMLIAFAFMFVGFLFLRVSYPLLLAGIFAVFDFLPVIGVGTFLVPWGVWLLLDGSVGRGVGILVLYGIITVVRQFAEPHLIGKGYGIHPLLTLLSMYAGARCAGAVGLLLGPVFALLVYGLLFPPPGQPERKRSALKKNRSSENIP